MENIFAAFADKANLIWGAVLTGLSYAFGAHWPLFAFFFVLNVVDYVYGVLKARATDTMSSAKGAKEFSRRCPTGCSSPWPSASPACSSTWAPRWAWTWPSSSSSAGSCWPFTSLTS